MCSVRTGITAISDSSWESQGEASQGLRRCVVYGCDTHACADRIPDAMSSLIARVPDITCTDGPGFPHSFISIGYSECLQSQSGIMVEDSSVNVVNIPVWLYAAHSASKRP